MTLAEMIWVGCLVFGAGCGRGRGRGSVHIQQCGDLMI